MEKVKLDHVTQVIGYHPKYLDHFLRTQQFILYGDGPLPYNYRLYLAIMVSPVVNFPTAPSTTVVLTFTGCGSTPLHLPGGAV